MSKEIEVFRLTPEKGKHYYAVVATRKIWDKTFNNTLGDWRYFAQESNKRYMGCFERSLRSGCGDGGTYTEVYIKGGLTQELHYDYEGMTCLEETAPQLTGADI